MESVKTICFFFLYGIVHAKEISTPTNPESTHRYYNSSFIPNISSSAGEHYMLEWILVSAEVIIVVTACLIINVLRRLRQRRSKHTINVVTHRNGRKHRDNTSGNLFQSMQIVHTPEGNKVVLKDNKTSYNLTDFTYIKNESNVKQNRKYISSKSTICKDQTDPIVPSSSGSLQSEPTCTFDHAHRYEELENQYQPDHRHLHSKLSAKSTENISEQSYKYDYVIQHNIKTLRTPKTNHTVIQKTRKENTVAISFSRQKYVNEQSPSRVDSPMFYENNQTRPGEIHGMNSRAGSGSCDFNNKLSPICNELEDSLSVDRLDYQNDSKNRRCKRMRNSQHFKSRLYVNIPESTEFYAGTKSQSVSQTLNHDFIGNVLEHSSALHRGHRRSNSCGALYENQMSASNVRRSMIISANNFIDENYYESY